MTQQKWSRQSTNVQHQVVSSTRTYIYGTATACKQQKKSSLKSQVQQHGMQLQVQQRWEGIYGYEDWNNIKHEILNICNNVRRPETDNNASTHWYLISTQTTSCSSVGVETSWKYDKELKAMNQVKTNETGFNTEMTSNGWSEKMQTQTWII